MTPYYSVNVKLPYLQIDKLKSATKRWNWSNLRLSSSMIDNANNATNFLYVLLLTHTQVANHCKIFGLLIKGVTETIENEAKRLDLKKVDLLVCY